MTLILWMFELGFITLTLLSADVDARHGVEFGRWLSLSLSLFRWLSNKHDKSRILQSHHHATSRR
jgi:hypothetical protein